MDIKLEKKPWYIRYRYYLVLLRVLATDAKRHTHGFCPCGVQFVNPLSAGTLVEVAARDDERLFRLA